MKFVMTYEIGPDAWEPAVSRFLESGGLPPEGVTMVGRWHAVGTGRGFLLLESNDLTAVYRFAAQWGDVCVLDVVPVVDDEQAAASF